jgi:hypothetical protein
MAKIRKLNITDEVDKVNTRGAGEPRSKNIYVNAHGNVTLSGVVPAAGYNIKTAVAALGAPGAPIGFWIEVSVLPDSALTTQTSTRVSSPNGTGISTWRSRPWKPSKLILIRVKEKHPFGYPRLYL